MSIVPLIHSSARLKKAAELFGKSSEQLDNDYTKDELLNVAKLLGVKASSSQTKAEIIGLLLDGAAEIIGKVALRKITALARSLEIEVNPEASLSDILTAVSEAISDEAKLEAAKRYLRVDDPTAVLASEDAFKNYIAGLLR